MTKKVGLKSPPFSQRLQKEMRARGSPRAGRRQRFAAGGRAGRAWKCHPVPCSSFPDMDSQKIWLTEEAGSDLGRTVFYHRLVLEGMVTGAQVLNLLLHTDGLKPEQILKLFPLSVK